MEKAKTGYAYLDRGGILHISASRDTASDYSANGKVVETEVGFEHGFPTVTVDGEATRIIAYSETEMKYTATGRKIEVIPELAELYSNCR